MSLTALKSLKSLQDLRRLLTDKDSAGLTPVPRACHLLSEDHDMSMKRIDSSSTDPPFFSVELLSRCSPQFSLVTALAL